MLCFYLKVHFIFSWSDLYLPNMIYNAIYKAYWYILACFYNGQKYCRINCTQCTGRVEWFLKNKMGTRQVLLNCFKNPISKSHLLKLRCFANRQALEKIWFYADLWLWISRQPWCQSPPPPSFSEVGKFEIHQQYYFTPPYCRGLYFTTMVGYPQLYAFSWEGGGEGGYFIIIRSKHPSYTVAWGKKSACQYCWGLFFTSYQLYHISNL